MGGARTLQIVGLGRLQAKLETGMSFRKIARKVFLWPGRLYDKNAADNRAQLESDTCHCGQEKPKGKRSCAECDSW